MLSRQSGSLPHMRLDASNLPDLARGCAVLAAGGGGDPHLTLTMAQLAVAEHGPVSVVRPGDLPEGALVMPCGQVGSATVAGERLWSGDEGRILREAVESVHGATIGALMCFQIGGRNGLLPVTWAARAGLPLLDADGMGRTFPGLHQQAMHLDGVSAAPVVLVDGRGNTLVLHAADELWAERLARHAAASLGGLCAGALFCMSAARARTAAIAGSVSRALELGAAIAADGVRALGAILGAEVLIEGSVLDVERGTERGVARGAATVRGGGPDAGRLVRLEMQSEYLLLLEDGEVRAAVPDLLSVLGAETGEPISAEELRRGRRVAIVAAPAPAVWRSDRGLALVGPGAFGYDAARAPA